MKRVLLIGRDPLFAWALEKRISSLGYHLEHIYTLTEARIRISRFRYDVFLLDGLAEDELEAFSEMEVAQSTVYVFDDTRQHQSSTNTHTVFINKENGLSSLISFLQELA